MKSSAKRAISLLVASLFFISALAVYAVLIKPVYEDALVLRGTLASQKQLFNEQEKAMQKINDLVQRYQGTGKLQDVISLSLPSTENISSVFSQLYAIAQSSGVGIEVFGVQPLAIKPAAKDDLVRDLGTLRLNVRLIGRYQDFKNFLRGLETNIRLMDVVNLKVDRAGTPIQDVFLYNLVVDAYYQVK